MPPTIGLKLLHAGENPVFDIVAVHGLNGDAYRTWTWKATKKGEKEVLWLRDLLPKEIQDARIFTYGYDSIPTQVAGRASTKFIHQHAEAFLQDLHAHRRGDEVYRPIIFIAHSLGGILVKQVLINSSDCHVGHNEHLRSILNSTYGIMFLGTPHNGSGLATWGKFAESVISHIFPKLIIDTNPHLINTLGRNSEVLQNITRRFVSVQHQNPFKIFYFWEELKTKLPNGRMETIVEYSSAVPQDVADVQTYGIHGDHSSISRFENEESPGYDVIVRALVDWREAAPEAVNLKWAQYRDQVILWNMHNISPPGSYIGTPPSKFLLPPPPESEFENMGGRLIMPADDDISPLSSTILSPKSEPHFIVSQHANEVFEGRQEDLERLDRILQNPKKREWGNAGAVVSGISGSGKTHLVRQYVYEKRNNYPGGVFWVEAVSSASIKLGYWKLAMGLGLIESSRFNEGPRGDLFVHLVTDWFKSHSRWLLVFDGADHETESEVDLLKEILPGGTDGAIIITTVNKALAGRARLGSPEGLSLGTLSTQDCVNMLFRYAMITDPSPEDIKDAEELVELMDLLPLAIHSAGSSMTVMQMDLGSYLRYYKKQPEVEGLTSFHIILDQLQGRYPEASNLIYILSFVERKVPVAMVEWGMKCWNGPPLVAKKHGLGLNITLGHLLSYSLIERKSVAEIDDPGRVDTLVVHRVVQDICWLRMKQKGRLEEYFFYAAKMFCKSFRRMEQRRRDKNFSVSDYRRFQVHIAKILKHGNAMKYKSEDMDDALHDLEDVLTRIKNAINRYTPKYGSQSTDDGDGEYMPPRSQFTGSWSSLDESCGSSSEAAEIVFHPDNLVLDSPLDHFGPLFPSPPAGYEESSPTIGASGSPPQDPTYSKGTPSPINGRPFALPGGSPPSAPPPLPREFISGLTPRNPNNPFSPPYPPTPGGPTKFPPFPRPLDTYEEHEIPGALTRNYSDPALTKRRSISFIEHASRSHGDLTIGRGVRMHGSLPLSRETSVNPLRDSPSRDPSRARELTYPQFDTMPWAESSGAGMARVRSEGSGGSLKYGGRIMQKLSAEAMSRSTSTGSMPGGVSLLSPTHSEPMSRQGSVGSVGSLPRYHKLSTRESLPVPPIDSEHQLERELLPEERKGYHARKESGPGFHVQDGYNSGVDGVGGTVIEFGAPLTAVVVDRQGSRRGSVAGLGINLSPAVNPAEYLAASRRSSAPGAVQDPHHHGLQHYHHTRTPPTTGATGVTNCLPSGSGSVASPRSQSPVEAAGGAFMQRSISEPNGGVTGAAAQILAEREAARLAKAGGVTRGRASLRRVSRAISPLGGKAGKRYSPREAFMEYEPALDEEPLFETWESVGDGGKEKEKGKGKRKAE